MPESIAAPARSDEAAKVQQASQSRAGLVGLAIGSIGVVYGDIGTSPLYALREAVNAGRRAGRPRDTRRRVRRAVAHPVGAPLHRDVQIRRRPPARRQQWRGLTI
jgi:K+ potassium transporter